jgi:O-methyltransferase involved in polyketide biosynthesis
MFKVREWPEPTNEEISMTIKNVNYTPEQTAAIVAGYRACDSDESRKAFVEAYAAEHGRKASSVRAKLVREGVYIKPERTAKRSAKKADMVAAIAARTGANPELVDSLEKATAKALSLVLAALPEIEDEEISES